MKIQALLSCLLTILISFGASAFTIQGMDLNSGKTTEFKPGPKGSVIVFMSAKCPCSNSHVEELKSLQKEYPDYGFVAVHSNTDESKEETEQYFKEAGLPFPVIQDTGAKIAGEFKALKTPHAFLVSPSGETLYKGGLSNSKDCRKADRKFLREALTDLAQGHPVKTPEGRTLGCAIARGEKHVW